MIFRIKLPSNKKRTLNQCFKKISGLRIKYLSHKRKLNKQPKGKVKMECTTKKISFGIVDIKATLIISYSSKTKCYIVWGYLSTKRDADFFRSFNEESDMKSYVHKWFENIYLERVELSLRKHARKNIRAA